MTVDFSHQIATELSLQEWQVRNAIELFDEGNTIPFVARYRKERTGELDEEELRKVQERHNYLRSLEERKAEVLRLIEEQGKLTPELAEKIQEAVKMQTVEDLYRPFRPKRRTRATIARERGLEPLAELISAQEGSGVDLDQLAQAYINLEQEVPDSKAALAGAKDILAEEVADAPEIRGVLRKLTWQTGMIVSTASGQDQAGVYQMYAEYQEPLSKVPPHRILALNRGEREELLRVQVVVSEPSQLVDAILNQVLRAAVSPWQEIWAEIVEDAYKRLLAPSLEREIRSELTEKAETQAINVFAQNLRALLLQPPIRGRRVLAIDPGYRTGCKVAVVNEYGDLLATETIYPHPPQQRWAEAKKLVSALVAERGVLLIAIGNGTASRETEQLAAEIIKEISSNSADLQYVIVSEAGASVYSASPLAREELPDLDVSLRGAVSIARRVQDPLAELVKIEPKAIGVGQYQHDVNQSQLAETLAGVVESAVNYVGVNLNTASPALLSYVAGVSSAVAKNMVSYRQEHGPFSSRAELLKVPRLGPATFRQCAGFLRIPESPYPLDNTAVHPESYQLTERILAQFGFTVADLKETRVAEVHQALSQADPKAVAEQLEAGIPTVRDILAAIFKPGRDPRDEMPAPILRTDVLSLEDLQPGMQLKGTVRNVVDFGAFVDIGVKQDGLVHISQLSDRYVKHPLEVVSVGDVVTVRVLEVDLQRQRIALSMKPI